MVIRKIGVSLLLLLVICTSNAQELSDKANSFLNSLSEEQKEQAHYTFEDEERFNMNFVPKMRNGPTFHDFNTTQKELALNLLRASLSAQGYEKTTEIMELENVLFELENNNQKMEDGRPYRDPLNYHFCIFGDPAPDSFWGWRFEGHHISFNFTAANGTIVSSTPTFFGSNPGIVKSTAQKGKEVLKKETDLGFALINSMSEEQLRTALFSDAAPSEIITGNHRKVKAIEPLGIAYDQLSDEQKAMFMQLVNVYIDNYESKYASNLKKKLSDNGLDKLYFAWAGSLAPVAGHYYRIQSTFLLIEYDNIQNNANHVHTAIRDLDNDYAEDTLSAHYKAHHKN
ncbi:DUF3500 domain-containing protein [Maribacter halichondriae]|uniref:DUF3500 domain-containing protein n=1 Tax=Maribacter halichondriae TaxID=2980554 RepID=UPI002359163B|nr:DUF3500 domain-containing protein [Maribacter sp. Hal144]